ncbi:hypothetical protein [Nonomuraea composti]|uniref:hypothetical protein n=1 Tax=Nonomuraea composti TaxID=2720023 RepID=UPI00197DC8A8|nr:hypothetical protein [Nonomuraea sp. FMUSA5-5]
MEQAEARDERERPWRATSLTQEWSDAEQTPEASAARGLLEQVIADPSERPEGARPVLLTTLLVPLSATGTGD